MMKKIFLLSLLLPIWMALVIVPVYCTTYPRFLYDVLNPVFPNLCSGETSSWFSFFLSVIGFPILAVQLYFLNKTIEESIWEPQISAGFLVAPLDHKMVMSKPISSNLRYDLDTLEVYFENETSLYKLLNNPNSLFPIRLVIINRGKKVASFLKIHLKLIQFPGDTRPELLAKDFTLLPDGVNLIYKGGADNVVYPNDFEEFQVIFGLNKDEFNKQSWHAPHYGGTRYFNFHLSRFFTEGDYVFSCTVWAEGLTKPFQERLIVSVTSSKEADNNKSDVTAQPLAND